MNLWKNVQAILLNYVEADISDKELKSILIFILNMNHLAASMSSRSTEHNEEL
jgi:hypothetical protein